MKFLNSIKNSIDKTMIKISTGLNTNEYEKINELKDSYLKFQGFSHYKVDEINNYFEKNGNNIKIIENNNTDTVFEFKIGEDKFQFNLSEQKIKVNDSQKNYTFEELGIYSKALQEKVEKEINNNILLNYLKAMKESAKKLELFKIAFEEKRIQDNIEHSNVYKLTNKIEKLKFHENQSPIEINGYQVSFKTANYKLENIDGEVPLSKFLEIKNIKTGEIFQVGEFNIYQGNIRDGYYMTKSGIGKEYQPNNYEVKTTGITGISIKEIDDIINEYARRTLNIGNDIGLKGNYTPNR